MALLTIYMSGNGKKAKSVLHTKVLLKNGVIVEIKIWKVTDKLQYPDRYKYSLYCVYEGMVLVGYDNHHPKGHHRHVGGTEMPYHFKDLKALRNDFKADIEVQLAKRGLS